MVKSTLRDTIAIAPFLFCLEPVVHVYHCKCHERCIVILVHFFAEVKELFHCYLLCKPPVCVLKNFIIPRYRQQQNIKLSEKPQRTFCLSGNLLSPLVFRLYYISQVKTCQTFFIRFLIFFKDFLRKNPFC